jgi:epoxyqueuosine reductase
MINALLNEIAAHGDRGAVVPVSRFDDLKRGMEDLRSGEHHAWSDWMAGEMVISKEPGFEPRSLIVVVTPSPKVMLEFNAGGRPVPCIVPPYYTDECTVGEKVLRYINAFLAPLGFAAADAGQLPQKLLAVHCGLTAYGRCNISFSKDYGSYIRLLTYVSDLPCEEAPWFPTRRMDACQTCDACVNACPTGAIDADHRVIDASKCLTSKNETPGDFPDWIPADAHNSLVGCLKCQDCCPANAHIKDNISQGVAFTSEETAELLGHRGDSPFSDTLSAKLEATGISPEFWPLLPRNLGVLLHRVMS